VNHLCRRWWRRGLSCPFAPHDGEEKPGGPDFDDESVRRPPAITLPERKRLRQMIKEVMSDFEGDTDAAVMAEAVRRVGEQLPVMPGVAEEAVADTVRDRVFKMPELPDLPAVPLAPRPRAGARGFAGGGFFFDATQRLFGLVRQFPNLAGGFGGGPPGAGPSGGGQGGV